MITPKRLDHTLKDIKAKAIYLEWDQFIDTMQHEKQDPRCIKENFNRNSRKQDFDKQWSGSSTWEEALDFLESGWKDGREKLRHVVSKLPPDLFEKILPSQGYAKTSQHQISGGVIDMGLAVNDIGPNHFVEEAESELKITTGNKLQTIYINCGNNCNIDSEMFFVRGSLMYSMCNHLEVCGYNTEVWAYFPQSNSSWGKDHQECLITYVRIKQFNEVFDEHKMLIALCSAFMFRRFVFSIEECTPYKMVKAYGFGPGFYGSVIQSITPEDLKIEEKENQIVFDVANQNNREKIIEQFKIILKGLKIVSHDGLGDQFMDGNEGSWAM